MKVLFDTNVWISALISHGVCNDLFHHCEKNHTLVTTPLVLVELEHILPDKFHLPYPDTVEILRDVLELSELEDPVPLPRDSCRDKGDLPILGAAVGGKCHCLITGDKDLLALKRFRGVAILTPNDFWRFEDTRRP